MSADVRCAERGCRKRVAVRGAACAEHAPLVVDSNGAAQTYAPRDVDPRAIDWDSDPRANAVPALTTPEPGCGELAGGDVQPLPVRKRRGPSRNAERHAQRAPLGRYLGTISAGTPGGTPLRVVRDLDMADVERDATFHVEHAPTKPCVGACGETKPVASFPTFKRSTGTVRGDVCRKCRRESGEVNYG